MIRAIKDVVEMQAALERAAAKENRARVERQQRKAQQEAEREAAHHEAFLSMANSFDRIATALEQLAGKGADDGRD